MLQAAGTQPLQTWIDRSRATVAEWVSTGPIFEVCAQEKGNKGGGRWHATWWRQTTAET